MDFFAKLLVKSGSFVCDTELKIKDWIPSEEEKNCLTRIGYHLQLSETASVFERLEVDGSTAEEMFSDNR